MSKLLGGPHVVHFKTRPIRIRHGRPEPGLFFLISSKTILKSASPPFPKAAPCLVSTAGKTSHIGSRYCSKFWMRRHRRKQSTKGATSDRSPCRAQSGFDLLDPQFSEPVETPGTACQNPIKLQASKRPLSTPFQTFAQHVCVRQKRPLSPVTTPFISVIGTSGA